MPKLKKKAETIEIEAELPPEGTLDAAGSAVEDDLPEIPADEYDPDQKYVSPFEAQLESADEARQEDADRIAGEVAEDNARKKRGRSLWKSGIQAFRRDIMNFGGVKNNSHPKYPHLYFRPVARNRVTERKYLGYRVASKQMIDDMDEVFGESRGLTSAAQRNEMILMYIPKKYKEDRDAMISMQTDAQEADLEAAAAEEGLKPVVPGQFGKNKLRIFNQRYRGQYKGD